jgi:replicative DNA helicase
VSEGTTVVFDTTESPTRVNGQSLNPHVSGLSHGHPKPADPAAEAITLPDRGYAYAVGRLLHGRKIAEKTRRALPAEWSKLVGYVESSYSGDPGALFRCVQKQYLDSLAGRQPKVAGEIKAALDLMWAELAGSDPGDEKEDPDAPRSFLRGIKGATEFNRTKFRMKWLIRDFLVDGQPGVVGAPKKSMKTSTMVDLAVSLASGLPALGKFEVPEPVPVLLISGESGGYTLQETIRRVCGSKGLEGIDVESLEGRLFIGDELPQLGVEQDLDALAAYIRDHGIRVVIIDPLYLCLFQGSSGKRLDPGNLYDVGPLLLAVSRTCLDAGAAPILVHHFKKNGADPYDLPELEELAFAGIQEFSRQWILLKRRERFEPGSGCHQLWLVVGGSAGHAGEWALDIDEGSWMTTSRGDAGKCPYSLRLRPGTTSPTAARPPSSTARRRRPRRRPTSRNKRIGGPSTTRSTFWARSPAARRRKSGSVT